MVSPELCGKTHPVSEWHADAVTGLRVRARSAAMLKIFQNGQPVADNVIAFDIFDMCDKNTASVVLISRVIKPLTLSK